VLGKQRIAEWADHDGAIKAVPCFMSEAPKKFLRWWILEDALRDRRGHWFEYQRAFLHGLSAEGDSVRFFVSKECSPEVAAVFQAQPVLPRSIWARMSDKAPKWRRLLRIPVHGLATYRAVSRLLAKYSAPHAPSSKLPVDRTWPDLIFVPTVLVHHLIGWIPLIKWKLRSLPTRVLLFFPNTPVDLDASGKPMLAPEPTAKFFRWCIQRLASEVRNGRVILGAETRPMTQALTEITGVPFTYLPHPVEISGLALSESAELRGARGGPLVFGAYGAARADKGSDLLQKAIRLALEEWPEIPVKFVVQWIKDFQDQKGQSVSCDPWLREHPKVEVIDEVLAGDDYTRQFRQTDLLLLPYGTDYRLRVSRVVIEALVGGKPVVVASATTLEEQSREFGASIAFDGASDVALLDALKLAVKDIDKLVEQARQRASAARHHFSVTAFRGVISGF